MKEFRKHSPHLSQRAVVRQAFDGRISQEEAGDGFAGVFVLIAPIIQRIYDLLHPKLRHGLNTIAPEEMVGALYLAFVSPAVSLL